jgi:hypothetical protein
VIFFSNLWGLYYGEWNGISRRTWFYVWSGLLALVLSTVVSGPVAYLFSPTSGSAAPNTPAATATSN